MSKPRVIVLVFFSFSVSKPNVIVVQKTQARRPQIPAQVTKGGTTVITSPAAFEKVNAL